LGRPPNGIRAPKGKPAGDSRRWNAREELRAYRRAVRCEMNFPEWQGLRPFVAVLERFRRRHRRADLECAAQALCAKWDAATRRRWARGEYTDASDKQQAMADAAKGNF
jgi:hypothetical protein